MRGTGICIKYRYMISVQMSAEAASLVVES